MGWGSRYAQLPSHAQRKSLRERWLMDGAAEGTEQPEDSTSKDPQSPEGQAQARIRNLEDSLFT